MPAIPQAVSGLRELTAKNLVLDSGLVWRNPNVTVLRASASYFNSVSSGASWIDPNGSLVVPTKMGATRGGTTININRDERQVEVDGRRTDVKGLARTNTVVVELSTTLLEMGDPNTVDMAMGSADQIWWPSGNTERQTGDALVEYTPNLIPSDFDYIGTVGIAATISGENQPVFCILENCKVVGNVSLPFADNNELAVQVTLRGHSLLTDPTKIPLHVFVPHEFDYI